MVGSSVGYLLEKSARHTYKQTYIQTYIHTYIHKYNDIKISFGLETVNPEICEVLEKGLSVIKMYNYYI